MKRYVGIDCGGTNLRIYEVNPLTGELLKDLLEKKIDLREINSNTELTEIIFNAVAKINDTDVYVGCSAAGNIDEENLVLIQSPNSGIKEPVTFARALGRVYKVTLINDMKAAVLGAAKFGQGKGLDNVLVATYSSGYNCMKAYKRKLIEGISPEFGHQQYYDKENLKFSELECGCGGFSHLETAVSGNGAAKMARKYFEDLNCLESNAILDMAVSEIRKIKKGTFSFEEVFNEIKSEHVYRAFRENPEQEPQRRIKDFQTKAIMQSFAKMISSYNPLDIIICMGSQAEKDGDLLIIPASSLFYENFDELCMHSLKKPEIVINDLSEIGVRGAVAYNYDFFR